MITEARQQEHAQLKYGCTREQVADMMAKHFRSKKAHLWQYLLELSLIFPASSATTAKTPENAKNTSIVAFDSYADS
eukprot:567291-Pyramimonas_sp.AAC.1